MPASGSTRSPIALALFAIFFAVVFAGLGYWQLGRVYRPVDGYSAEPAAVRLSRLVPSGAAVRQALVGRQVTVTGHYLASEQSIRTGQRLGSVAVSWVVTPLATSVGTTVDVVRGWITGTASKLAEPPSGSVTVTGRLAIGRVRGPVDGRASATTNAYLVRTAQSPPDPLSLQPVPSAPPRSVAPASFHLQNATYVVQWWVLVIIVLVSWWKLSRTTTSEADAADPVRQLA